MTPQSREYWSHPIDKSVSYPGEQAHSNAKIAYRHRLGAYLSKSPPIWALINNTLPCPLTSDQAAIDILHDAFGQTWTFLPKDIDRSLRTLNSRDIPVATRVETAMNAGSELPAGSWVQRNRAIYSTICDTLDLSRNGRDLDMMQVVDPGNGLALYNLIDFRLQDIKSSDPLARAIKIRMGLQHITYRAKPHGVASYFAAIESHRS